MIDSSLELHVEAVQAHVAYCLYCQPYDGGDPVWVFGRRGTVDEVLDLEGVPENLRDEVAARISCPNCGKGGFERWEDYGAKSEHEIRADARWEKWYDEYQGRVEDFAAHLKQFPYLGLLHPVGKLIHDSINSFKAELVKDQVWRRARKPIGAKMPTVEDMMPPPPNLAAAEGRFSHFGQSVFYLANNDQAALAEILDRDSGENVGWVQDFQVHDAGRILDLRRDVNDAEDESIPIVALGLISEHLPSLQPNPDSAWKPEYFVPRFIADVARHEGFDGIMFESRKHYYCNLVLFSWNEDRIEPDGTPRLVTLDTKALPGSEQPDF